MNVNDNSDNVFRLLGQVIGDPLHREGCVWVGDNGKRCRNIVKKQYRVEGAICLQALREAPSSFSTTQQLAIGGKFLLCPECRSHRCRPRKWAESVIRSLDMQADQTEIATALNPESCKAAEKQQQWPLSLLVEIGTSAQLQLTSSTL